MKLNTAEKANTASRVVRTKAAFFSKMLLLLNYWAFQLSKKKVIVAPDSTMNWVDLV